MIVKRGDIFYADLSPVVGSEQGGLRPVLIVQNDVGNKYSPTVIAAAITSKTGKTKLPTHIDVSGDNDEAPGLARDSVILLEQVRTIDKRRLRERIGNLDLYTMQKVNSAISVSLGLMEETPSYAFDSDNTSFERTHPHSAVASVGVAYPTGTAVASTATQPVINKPAAEKVSSVTASVGSSSGSSASYVSEVVGGANHTLSDSETNANVVSAPNAVFEMPANTAAEATVNTVSSTDIPENALGTPTNSVTG